MFVSLCYVAIHIIQIGQESKCPWISHIFNDSTNQYYNILCCNVFVFTTFYWKKWLKSKEKKLRGLVSHLKHTSYQSMYFSFYFLFHSFFLFLHSMTRILNLHSIKKNNKGLMDIMELWISHSNIFIPYHCWMYHYIKLCFYLCIYVSFFQSIHFVYNGHPKKSYEKL